MSPGLSAHLGSTDACEQMETVLTHKWQPLAAVCQPLWRLLLSLDLSMFLQGEIPFLCLGQAYTSREVVVSLLLLPVVSASICYFYVPYVMFGQQSGGWENSSQISRILVAEGQPPSSARLKQVSRTEERQPFPGACQKNRQDPYPRELRFSWGDRLGYILEELNK